jgi:hypothetical protein
VLCTKKNGISNPYFSLGLQMVISTSFHHYWATGTAVSITRHSDKWWAIAFSDNGFRFKLSIFLHDTKLPEINVFTPIYQPYNRIVRRHYL